MSATAEADDPEQPTGRTAQTEENPGLADRPEMLVRLDERGRLGTLDWLNPALAQFHSAEPRSVTVSRLAAGAASRSGCSRIAATIVRQSRQWRVMPRSRPPS